jgi:ubiquinone/menaquinone biosynthesis C-methylase UbiE
MTEDTREVHEHVLSLLEAEETGSVLDLGCGRGEHMRMLAQSMPPDARLVGLDFRENVLEEARSAVRDDPRFVFLQHDLNERLPFEGAEFDRILSVNTLEAIPAKNELAREAHRVLKPGGRLVCAHYDWESQLFDGGDKEIVRRLVRAFADCKLSWMTALDGWMGRRLWGTFQGLGLFEGQVDAYTHTSTSYEPGCYGWERSRDMKGLIKRGMIPQREYDVFIDGLEELAEQQRFFFAITMFSYVGVKPA